MWQGQRLQPSHAYCNSVTAIIPAIGTLVSVIVAGVTVVMLISATAAVSEGNIQAPSFVSHKRIGASPKKQQWRKNKSGTTAGGVPTKDIALKRQHNDGRAVIVSHKGVPPIRSAKTSVNVLKTSKKVTKNVEPPPSPSRSNIKKRNMTKKSKARMAILRKKKKNRFLRRRKQQQRRPFNRPLSHATSIGGNGGSTSLNRIVGLSSSRFHPVPLPSPPPLSAPPTQTPPPPPPPTSPEQQALPPTQDHSLSKQNNTITTSNQNVSAFALHPLTPGDDVSGAAGFHL